MVDEFDNWFYASKYAQVINQKASTKQVAFDGWEAATESMQVKLDAQAEELAALRGFAKATYKDNALTAFQFGLYDSNYEPTYILTGEKELGISSVLEVKE